MSDFRLARSQKILTSFCLQWVPVNLSSSTVAITEQFLISKTGTGSHFFVSKQCGKFQRGYVNSMYKLQMQSKVQVMVERLAFLWFR